MLLRSLIAFAFAISHLVYASSQSADAHAPELATGIQAKQQVTAKHFLVSAANPLAADAGYQMLKRGGSAVDAYIATQLVLGLVEPQSSGIGGGGFAVYYDAEQSKLTSFDGRETAPAAAKQTLFLSEDGKPMGFFDAVVGGRSVGVPGLVAMMEQMHQAHGKLPWQDLFEPAITLASKGFEVSPRLATLIANDQQRLSTYLDTQAYFFHSGSRPLQAGELLLNLDYASSLKLIAAQGAKGFYQGQLAQLIAAKVQSVEDNPGTLTVEDLASYRSIEREALCSPYLQYRVCGMGPPSSGATTVGQILGMAQHYPLQEWGAKDLRSWRVLGDASRLAFADRGKYLADPDKVTVPSEGLLDADYMKQRADQLSSNKALEQVAPGTPPGASAALTSDADHSLPSTTHVSVVDAEGNVLSVTSSVENAFGSRVMVGGFLLNNQLTDFSFVAERNGVPVANRVEAGKRPRSSMSPTIVFERDKPILAIGSPGGSSIIGYVAKTIVAHLAWGYPLQQAIELPHLNNRFGTYEIEEGAQDQQWQQQLQALGYKTKIKAMTSGLQGVRIYPDSLVGGADPRREGVALGD